MHATRKTVVLLIISLSVDKYICMDKNWCLLRSLDILPYSNVYQVSI
jgi:hypothetical protein